MCVSPHRERDWGRAIQVAATVAASGGGGFDRGVRLHWHGSDEVLAVDEAVVNPVVAFTADGQLAVAGDQCGRVYDLDRYGVSTSRQFTWAGPAPVSIMATGAPTEFATLFQEGLVKVWRIL